MLKNHILTAVFGSALLLGAYAVAQQPAPKKNVSAANHPNLAAAAKRGITDRAGLRQDYGR